jgi:hypothetical protein
VAVVLRLAPPGRRLRSGWHWFVRPCGWLERDGHWFERDWQRLESGCRRLRSPCCWLLCACFWLLRACFWLLCVCRWLLRVCCWLVRAGRWFSSPRCWLERVGRWFVRPCQWLERACQWLERTWCWFESDGQSSQPARRGTAGECRSCVSPTYRSPPNATWSGRPVEFAAIVTIRFGQLAAGVRRVPRVRCPLLTDHRRTATSLGRRVTCAVIDVLAGRLVAVHAKGARHAGAGRHVVSVCPTANGRTSSTPASWRRGDGAREPAVQREGAVIRRLYSLLSRSCSGGKL